MWWSKVSLFLTVETFSVSTIILLYFQYVFILFIQAVIIPSYLTVKKTGIHLELTKCFLYDKSILCRHLLILRYPCSLEWITLIYDPLLSFQCLVWFFLVTFCLGYFLVDIHKWDWPVAFFSLVDLAIVSGCLYHTFGIFPFSPHCSGFYCSKLIYYLCIFLKYLTKWF